MSVVLNSSIQISEFERPQPESTSEATKFLIQCGDLNYVVSTPVKILVETLLTSQKLNIPLDKSYQRFSQNKASPEEVMALANKHIPSTLFAGAEVPARKTPFILSVNLLPERILSYAALPLALLFNKWLAFGLVSVFIAIHIWLFPTISQSAITGIPTSDIPIFIALMLLSYFIHELGHISACRRFNCPHGDIGVGIYFIFPVFFADVSKAWRLNRIERATVDLGGLYFQAILLIAIDYYAFANQSSLAYLLSWTITFTMLHTLNPFFKFDGYWLLSDLSGITNLHEKMAKALQAVKNKLLHQTPIGIQNNKTLLLLIPYSLLTIAFFLYVASFLLRKLIQTTAEIVSMLKELPVSGFLSAAEYIVYQGEIWVFIKGVVWIALIFTLLVFYTKRIATLIYPKAQATGK